MTDRPTQNDAKLITHYPFVMRAWEVRIYNRHLVSLCLDANSLDLPDGAPVTEWRDTSAELTRHLLPRWFKVWLWLRTKWARLTRSLKDRRS